MPWRNSSVHADSGCRSAASKTLMSRDAESGSNYLRSTICFPEKTVRDLNPQLIDLFKEVIGYEEREKTQAEGTVPV